MASLLGSTDQQIPISVAQTEHFPPNNVNKLFQILPRRITVSPYRVFDIPNVLKLVIQRTWVSLTTFPSIRGWLESLALFLVVAIPAYFLTTMNGWFDKPAHTEPSIWWAIFVGAFFAPALFEEIIMRSWLVPHPSENVTRRWRRNVIIGALFFFVIVHPINGLLAGGLLGETFTSC